jgi:hypothetical protein
MEKWRDLGLEDFLASNPTMRLKQYGKDGIIIEGEYRFAASLPDHPTIQEVLFIKAEFPGSYPRDIPKVYETRQVITRDSDFHTYEDGSFCLGSELRIKAQIADHPRIPDFWERIVDHFLYGIRHKQLYGSVPFGELAHGEDGLIDDYQSFFQIEGKKAVLGVLNALGKRKRVANKQPCPCNCGRRLGKCDFRIKLAPWRILAKRRWFRTHLKNSFTALPPAKSKRTRKPKKQTLRSNHSS